MLTHDLFAVALLRVLFQFFVLPLIMVRKDYYYSYTVSVNQPADSVGAV